MILKGQELMSAAKAPGLPYQQAATARVCCLCVCWIQYSIQRIALPFKNLVNFCANCDLQV